MWFHSFHFCRVILSTYSLFSFSFFLFFFFSFHILLSFCVQPTVTSFKIWWLVSLLREQALQIILGCCMRLLTNQRHGKLEWLQIYSAHSDIKINNVPTFSYNHTPPLYRSEERSVPFLEFQREASSRLTLWNYN